MRTPLRAAGCGLLVATFFSALAFAQDAAYPAKPIRVIVAQEAGSAGDNGVRAITTALGEALGQPLVVENRPGAGGALGMGVAAAAAPNGYTIAAIGSPQMVLPYVHKNLNYDLFRDFVAVGRYSVSQNVLVVPQNLAVDNVRELVALVKSKPGQLNMATAGPGSASHLAGLLFNVMAELQAVPIPYKGGGSAVTGLIANEVQYMVTPMQAVLGQIKGGRLKALGVGGESRAPQLPEVPTIAEAGLPAYRSIGWGGLLMPKGTPPAYAARVSEMLGVTISQPGIQQVMMKVGTQPGFLPGPAFDKFMREDFERFGMAAKAAGLKAE
jgi:tripartite-type tricarboxylate transporter receptor subunit TctC